MKNDPYNVIILAGGAAEPLTNGTGVDEKASLTIHDQPMLAWVLNAFQKSPEAGNLVVVGADNLDKLRCMEHVRKRIVQGLSVVQNLLHAVGYIKTRFYKGESEHQGYIISFGDTVFLTPEIVTETLQAIREADADIVMHYVERQTFVDANLPAERTYIPIGGKLYTGTGIYYVRKFSKIFSSLNELGEMRKQRKDPKGILRVIGCEGDDFPAIEKALSKRLDAKVKILVSPHAGMGMDVDKPSDYALARKILPSPLTEDLL